MSLLPFPSRPFDKPLPPVPADGTGDFCFTIDGKWFPYLLGAVGVLCAGGTWESEKERCISEAMTLLAQLMVAEPCPPEPEPDMTGLSGDDCMGCCLRWNEGVLEMLSCGVWTAVPGQAGNGFEPTQPGAGAPQPEPGGGTAEYCGALSGKQKYYLPTTVSAGDTILFSRLNGSWNDGIELAWHCPDGWLFVGGSCFETPVYNGGTDPLIGSFHMSIIAEIAGSFYDVLNIDSNGNPQVFTVPGGITDAPVVFQANVDYGGNIYGEVTFCVDVTNNQEQGDWVATFNFMAAPGPFHPAGNGQYTPGDGWTETEVTSGPNNYVGVNLALNTQPAFHIKRVQFATESAHGSNPQTVALVLDPGSHLVINTANINGTGLYDTGDIDFTGITTMEFDDSVGEATAPTHPGGTLKIQKCVIYGTGTNPFEV